MRIQFSLEHIYLPGALCPKISRSSPETMIESIKLKVNEAMFLLMKKLDKSLAYEKKTRKIAPKRVSINDKIRTIKT